MSGLLCLIFFFSGVSALMFETLWFRLAGLTFGNSVWATTLILSSFMGGLALGNAAAARWGHRIRHHVALYATLEMIIGVFGFSLVLLFPYFTVILAPIFKNLMEITTAYNIVRFLLAFLILLLPSTAMGATLPILVKALRSRDGVFGHALGRLYGWNTLGAVFGALAGEIILFEWLGIRTTGLVALSVNIVVAASAWSLRKKFSSPEMLRGESKRTDPIASLAHRSRTSDSGSSSRALSASAWRILMAAFLSGAILLGLEVVWFRFNTLFVRAIGLNFSMMLAVILAAIGLGSLAAASLLKHSPMARGYIPVLALFSGALTVISYGFHDLPGVDNLEHAAGSVDLVLFRSFRLMFPVSFLSGAMFTLLGEMLKQEIGGEVRSAGLLALFNTTGAMLGSCVTGFLLLPGLGMERSFWILSSLYGVVACLALQKDFLFSTFPKRITAFAAAAVFLLLVVIFPRGLMKNHFLKIALQRFTDKNQTNHVLAYREGLSETIILTGRKLYQQPFEYRLVTNGHSMSGVSIKTKRYMKDYVYLPIAFRPDSENALLISYGVGNTAKALVDTRSLERIDVVDISQEILDVNQYIFPDPSQHPLNDPRVHVHIEDGRHFLQTTDRRFDLITAEPPPPKFAGIVNLYTKEYFALVHECLRPEGIVTYWLPAYQLTLSDAQAIIRGFLDVFKDACLWTGAGSEWMLVGSRGLKPVKNVQDFTKQWRDPVVAPELQALGFETPGFMGASFIADAHQLQEFLADALPLTDNFPMRLSRSQLQEDEPWHLKYMQPDLTKQRFRNSAWIKTHWPQPLRDQALKSFDYQELVNLCISYDARLNFPLPTLHSVLQETNFRFLALWLRGVSQEKIQLAKNAMKNGLHLPDFDRLDYVDALADRDYAKALAILDKITKKPPVFPQLMVDRIYLLCSTGQLGKAKALYDEVVAEPSVYTLPPQFEPWLTNTFALDWATTEPISGQPISISGQP